MEASRRVVVLRRFRDGPVKIELEQRVEPWNRW